MERMNNKGDDYESNLWNVLAREHLTDLSQFHKRDLFDEMPLFSRDSDVDFLKDSTVDQANGALLGFALNFLESVVSYEKHRSPYFAAITVWSSTRADRVVPNLFVWSRPVEQLRRNLILDVVKTSFAKKIERIVSGRKLQTGFDFLEDTLTDPGETRVFVSLSQPPYKSFVALSTLRGTQLHAK
jgi:hypothetical protein